MWTALLVASLATLSANQTAQAYGVSQDDSLSTGERERIRDAAEAEAALDDWELRGFALGLAASWQLRDEFGNAGRTSFAPELSLQAFLSTSDPSLFLRIGARFGYVGLEQAESPSDLQFREHDVTGAVALSLLFDWYVIPSLTVGVGTLLRLTDVTPAEGIDSSRSRLNRVEPLFMGYLQMGLGFPIEGGVVVVEPFARYEFVPADSRIEGRFGADVSVSL